MIKSSFDIENELLSKGYDFVIGIDEVGRGPLAGPVVACAVIYRNFKFSISNFQTISNDKISNDKNFIKNIELIRDSKMLSEKQREGLFDFIQENFFVGVGLCDHETIDRMNILEASFLAMKKALNELARKAQISILKSIILVDGNKKIPNFSMDQRAIVGGDKIVKSISAASIVAKVTRDRMMKELHKKYPQYGFDKHKGYGTKFHVDALLKVGPCKIHRKTFEPVKTLVKKGK
ncbi:MAG: ribonuclease HII [Parcubacteria group bacterium]|jgi:ribonuclease HII